MKEKTKSFDIIPGQDYVVVRLFGVLDKGNLRGLDEKLQKHIQESPKYLIVNCEHVLYLSHEWIRALLNIRKTLVSYNKEMSMILAPSLLLEVFRSSGVDSAFYFAANLKEALTNFGLVQKKSFDAEFIDPFLTATLHVLKVQTNIDAVAGKTCLKKAKETLFGDVSGVIGIVSDSFNGSVVISFPETTFLQIMSAMLGETYTEISQEIIDGAGEITNMIFGQAKVVLNEKGYGIKAALPSVISGRNHTLSTSCKSNVVLIPFSSTAGDFFVEIFISA